MEEQVAVQTQAPQSSQVPRGPRGPRKTGSYGSHGNQAGKKESSHTSVPSKATSPRVYVGNLDYSTRSEGLKEHMEKCGTVVECQVLLQSNLRSKGCGIVEYSMVEEAQAAIDTLTDTTLDERSIFVREDREPEKNIPSYTEASDLGGKVHPHAGRKVFVGNLPFTMRWQDLKDFFQGCGDIVHADILTLADGTSRGQGNVLFATKEAAQNAIQLSGLAVSGRTINVREFSFD